jgi:uncharacterized membrane-anchored protein YhcB (DUF1043 family)
MTDMQVDQIILALVAGIPGMIAAFSSMRNGKEQKRVKDELRQTNGHLLEIKKKLRVNVDGNTASDPDWYQAPDLSIWS